MSAFASATNALAMTSAVTANLACYDIASSAKGQKTAAVIRNGQPAFWVLPSVATPVFAPSAFKSLSGDSSGKLSLCLNGGSDVMAQAEEIDEWAINYCTLHSERLFGKVLTQEQVLDRYNPIVKKSDKYAPFLKLKISPDRGPRTTGMQTSRVVKHPRTGRRVKCCAGPGFLDFGSWEPPLAFRCSWLTRRSWTRARWLVLFEPMGL